MLHQTRHSSMTFHREILIEKSGDYISPGRGWYHIYTFQPEKHDEEQLQWLPLEEKETLVLLRLDISAFRSCPIDKGALAFTKRIFTRFAEAGKDIILRILYDIDGKGMAHEPASFELVCDHIRSIGAIAAEHAGHILLAQGVAVGSWGEMHDSKYLEPGQIRQLWTIWNQATKGTLPLAVRRPAYARMIMPKGSSKERIGFYDDAILADETHMGTFGIRSRREASWQESWCAEDEYKYIRNFMNQVPVGGEVLAAQTAIGEKEVLAELQRMQISYLNSIYNPEVLDCWKKQILPNGESLYRYIGNHMGYRFFVSDVKYRRKSLVITIENNGFAPLYEEVDGQLIAMDGKQYSKRVPIDLNLRDIGPGAKKTFHVDNLSILQGESGYFLYLKAVRRRDGSVIRFANEGAGNQLAIGRIE